jgi:hypothetical protein
VAFPLEPGRCWPRQSNCMHASDHPRRPVSVLECEKHWAWGLANLAIGAGVCCRYNLYVGNACPWCHRVQLAIAFLGLDTFISITNLLDDAERASRGGWVFDVSTGLDPVFGARDLR